VEKEQGQTRNPLKIQGFPICPYYTLWAHILRLGATERGGCEDPLCHAGPLFSGLHAGHLRPRHDLNAETGSKRGRQFPLRHSPALTAPSSRMGHGLCQTAALKINALKKCRKQNQNHRNSTNFGGFGTP